MVLDTCVSRQEDGFPKALEREGLKSRDQPKINP